VIKRPALASVVALCALMAAAAVIINPGRHGAHSGRGIDPAAIVMDCSGNDANPGTLASPVRTFARAHALMGGRTSHTYLRGNCTYPASINVWQYSNETYEGYPADARMSAQVDISTTNVGCASCSNLAIRNLKIVGSNASDTMLKFFTVGGVPLNNISIEANWLVDEVNQPLQVYNANNLFIRGNKFDVGTTHANDDISLPFNDGANHTGLFVTDNTFVNCTRFCLETQNQKPTKTQINNVHIDRNTCDNCVTMIRGSYGYISAVTGSGTGNTIIGNTGSRAVGTPCFPSIEVAMGNATVSGNAEVNECYGFILSSNPGSVFQGNYFTFDLTTARQGFAPDGGYDKSGWIGINHYNVGGGFTDVAGCPANMSPSFCTLGFDTYGTSPPTTPASTPYIYASTASATSTPEAMSRQGSAIPGRSTPLMAARRPQAPRMPRRLILARPFISDDHPRGTRRPRARSAVAQSKLT
jgi:hypothetical protein